MMDNCAICNEPITSVSREIGDKQVCMKCNPFRRCGYQDCLGLIQSRPTPNCMNRFVCDKCGRKVLR